jgi:hypothetical protein
MASSVKKGSRLLDLILRDKIKLDFGSAYDLYAIVLFLIGLTEVSLTWLRTYIGQCAG